MAIDRENPPAMNPETDIASRLHICGVAELGDHAGRGITHVISLLDPETPEPEDFGRFGTHRRLNLRLHDVILPTAGMVAPSHALIEQVLAFGAEFKSAASPESRLLVHCHLGVSRSSAAMAAILAQDRDRDAEDVFKTLLRIRSRAWPNSWMITLADEVLGRGGALRRALDDHYRFQAEHRPRLVESIVRVGRAAEIPPDVILQP
jgi:predicted protein tyrosine phosphatase